jgi:GYF domain 2
MVSGEDRQRYGPLSDAEMRKFRELGHLVPSDLVWRKGFANWMPADTVFDLAK